MSATVKLRIYPKNKIEVQEFMGLTAIVGADWQSALPNAPIPHEIPKNQ